MNEQDIKNLFIKYKALLNGHFQLSSGLHSDTYFQSALILQYPDVAETLGKELGKQVKEKVGDVDTIVSPALGGLIIGQEVGRALGKRSIFCERVEGKLTMRRGFQVEPGKKIVVVEDVVTTGLSTREVVNVVAALGGNVVAVASLVDRSDGKADFGVPFISLLSLEVKSYQPAECPLCKSGGAPIKPGSRKT